MGELCKRRGGGEGERRKEEERMKLIYDAVYVTLAEKEDCKLITADAKLQRNVGGRTDVALL